MLEEPLRQIHFHTAKQVVQRLLDRLKLGSVGPGFQSLSPWAAVEQLAADLVVLLKECQGLLDRSADFLPLSVTIGVVGQGGPKTLGDADVVHDQAPRLVPEGPVHSGNGLHQPRTTHRLVDVHRVERRRVEASKPHVPDDHKLQRVLGVLGPLLELSQAVFVANMAVQLRALGRRARDDDLDRARVVVIGVPLGPKLDDLVIEAHADPAAHADDEALADFGGLPLLPVVHDVLSDLGKTLLCPNDRFDPSPSVFKFSRVSVSASSVTASNS